MPSSVLANQIKNIRKKRNLTTVELFTLGERDGPEPFVFGLGKAARKGFDHFFAQDSVLSFGKLVLPPSSVATRLRAVVQVRKRPGCAPQ